VKVLAGVYLGGGEYVGWVGYPESGDFVARCRDFSP
jgi:hypothetical protein